MAIIAQNPSSSSMEGDDHGDKRGRKRKKAAAAKKKAPKPPKFKRKGIVPPAYQLLPETPYHKSMMDKIRDMGGSFPPTYLNGKIVSKSDLNVNQNRILFTNKSANETALLAVVDGDDDELEKVKEGVEVSVVNRHGHLHGSMTLKYVGSSKAYRLIGKGLHRFLDSIELKPESHAIHMWAFSVAGEGGGRELMLALVEEDMIFAAEQEHVVVDDVAVAQVVDDQDGVNDQHRDAPPDLPDGERINGTIPPDDDFYGLHLLADTATGLIEGAPGSSSL